MTKYNIALEFMGTMQDKIVITIPKANNSLTDEDIIFAMNEIIANGIVVTNAGAPQSIVGAELISTTTVEYELN